MDGERDRRFREVVLERGDALLMLVAYHTMYDPDCFGCYGIGSNSGL